MKEMTLREVQAVSLDIMKHLHAFCEKYAIKYSLGYGSLIGAIRHKGFIPWDDDMDVVMMRKDFDRFCELFEDTENYKLFSFNRGNTYSTVARLCEMKRTCVKTGSPLFTEKTGLWIDIFPLDSVPEDKKLFEKEIPLIKEANNSIFLCRWQMRSISLKELIQIRTALNWIKHVRKARKSIKEYVKKQNEACFSFANQESSMMSMLAFPAYIDKDYSPKHVFDSVEEVAFEGEQFKIMKGYDEWLRIIYGDYMTPPPIEKQKRGHTVHNYYWK